MYALGSYEVAEVGLRWTGGYMVDEVCPGLLQNCYGVLEVP
jgi:hypothetical protein